jgi:hypothetical protein
LAQLLAIETTQGRRSLEPQGVCAPAPPDRRDILVVLVGVAAGILLFTLPDLIWWQRTGRLVWVSDPDDKLYLAVASQAYHNHPFFLSDPARAEGGVALYSWLPCVPGILLARLFDLGPVGIGLAWRILAATTIPLGWYLLVRRSIGPGPLAPAVVVLLTADFGSMFGRPLVRHADLLGRLLRQDPSWLQGFFRPPGMQWRVVTPGLIFVYYAAFLALLVRAREAPSRRRTVAAGLAFGLLFYVYFYYWTAVTLGLLLAALLDTGRRRLYVHVGGLGWLLGLPVLVSGFRMRGWAAEALMRFDLFLSVARGNVLSYSVPETALFAVCTAWILLRRRDLLPLGAVAASGWVLVNHQVITGLETQNDHWRLHVVGPTLTMIEVLIVLGWCTRLAGQARWTAQRVLIVLSGVELATGLAFRAVEATDAEAPLRQMTAERCYRRQRRARRAVRLEPNAVVAGNEVFVDWAMILDNQRMLYSDFAIRHSLTVGHDEWNDRAALNGYLRGLGRDAFTAEQRLRIERDFWGPWHRSASWRSRLLAERMAAYDAVTADPEAALDRFRVRYSALLPGRIPPRRGTRGWSLRQAGRYWWVWERRAGPGATAKAYARAESPGRRAVSLKQIAVAARYRPEIEIVVTRPR